MKKIHFGTTRRHWKELALALFIVGGASADSRACHFPPRAVCQSGQDCSRPWVTSIEPAPGSRGTALGQSIRVHFSEPMTFAQVSANLNIRESREPAYEDANDHPGIALVGGVVTPTGTATVFTFTPDTPLKNDTWYRVEAYYQMRDGNGNQMETTYDGCFETTLNRQMANVVTGQGGLVEIRVPAGAMPSDGYVAVSSSVASNRVAAATAKLTSQTNDPGRVPLASSVTDIKFYDSSGTVRSDVFAVPLSVAIAYPDADGDGYVDGAVPPVRAKTLRVHYLDETGDTWIRLFSSTVDEAARRVTAQVSHFTVFALIGQTDSDLSRAHVYPIPFRPQEGHSHVHFAGLGQNTTVKIYTPAGLLVRELLSPFDTDRLDWDVTNRAGDPVVSGVYFYVLQNGANTKKGKLIIIR